jgi:hypothetical protein
MIGAVVVQQDGDASPLMYSLGLARTAWHLLGGIAHLGSACDVPSALSEVLV